MIRPTPILGPLLTALILSAFLTACGGENSPSSEDGDSDRTDGTPADGDPDGAEEDLSDRDGEEAEPETPPVCDGRKIVVDPVSGERVSGPEPLDLPPLPTFEASDLPSLEKETPVRDGLWRITQEVTDNGLLSPETPIRLLVSVRLSDPDGLDAELGKLYNPNDPDYLKFLSPGCFNARYGPRPESVAYVAAYLTASGFTVDRIATNRLLLLVNGTADTFISAFGLPLHSVIRVKRPDFAVLGDLLVPAWLLDHLDAVVAVKADEPPDDPPEDKGEVRASEPIEGMTPPELSHIYRSEALLNQGFTGKGQTIGIPVGWLARNSDIESFWLSFGIQRTGSLAWRTCDRTPWKFAGETTVDVQYAGAFAPGADLVVYVASDNTDFSLSWAINEAVGEGIVSVITYSYSHQEVITAWEVQELMNLSARIGAAQGITYYAAAGDSREVDTPANAPYVTAVGASAILPDENGDRKKELDVFFAGRGRSALFYKPAWQNGVDVEGTRRCTVDLALHCYSGILRHQLLSYIAGVWANTTGTSLAAPMIAGMTALINQARGERGQIGWINRTLYTHEPFRSTFYDIQEGLTPDITESEPGWDFPTGWGAPAVDLWVETIP